MARRLLPSLIAVGVLAGACGGDDSTDPEAYCELIRAGTGIEATNEATQATELQVLLEVAPDEISASVQQLVNTVGGLSEIDELDQLFAAAFDPEAQAARTAFNEYATDVCGYRGTGLQDGALGSATDLRREVESYVDTRFGTDMWPSKVRYDPDIDDDGALVGIEVTFIIAPDEGEAVDACNAVAVWAFQIQDATGSVDVLDDDLVVVRSEGENEPCAEL